MMQTKTCNKCKLIKDLSLFDKHTVGKYGKYSICKDCTKERKIKYRSSADGKLVTKLYNKRNSEKRKKYGQTPNGKAKRKIINRFCKLKRNYGITKIQYFDLIQKQNNCCAICSTKFDDSSKIHVDHSHTTGVTIGLLCHNCNIGLGNFKDNIELLIKASGYLKETPYASVCKR